MFIAITCSVLKRIKGKEFLGFHVFLRTSQCNILVFTNPPPSPLLRTSIFVPPPLEFPQIFIEFLAFLMEFPQLF
jgi:hypothetical protein